MKNEIAWKDITDTQPDEGQQILYSYSYKYDKNAYERRVLIGEWNRIERNKYPMCYITHWIELPKPVEVNY